MIFDTSSPGRKNVLRVVYGVLAFLFFIGFVGFGVGGELGGGGIIDGLTGNNDGSTSEAFEQQIEDAEEEVAAAPGESAPLAELALLRSQSAGQQIETDEETGQRTITGDANAEFEEAIRVWEQYLETDPRKTDVAAGSAIVNAYIALGDANGAIETQARLAKDNPSVPNYVQLAQFYYSTLEIDKGDTAAENAVAEASGQNAKQIRKQLEAVREQAVEAKKQEAKQPNDVPGESPELENPFGGLNPTDPGATTPAP